MTLELTVVTIERVVYTADDVDMVIAPGVEGVLGVLARHEPIIAALKEGALEVIRGEERDVLAIRGGYMEVHGTQVVVMADAAERESEIDERRAVEARERAQKALDAAPSRADAERALAAMRRASVRLSVARRRRGPRSGDGPGGP